MTTHPLNQSLYSEKSDQFLKLAGLISLNGHFHPNDVSSPIGLYLGFKFHFNRLNRLETGRDYVLCDCLYFIVYT